MSMASTNLVPPSLRSLLRSSPKKRRAAKSKSARRKGPSCPLKASSRASSTSPVPLDPFPRPLPLPLERSGLRSIRSRSSSRSPRKPGKDGGPSRSRSPRSPRPSPFSPFSPFLFPACAKRTTMLPPSKGRLWKVRAFCACSSVRKVTKPTPLLLPSGFLKVLSRSMSPACSKNARMSSSCASPRLATKTCLGSASRGSLPLSLDFPLPFPFPSSRSLRSPKSMSVGPRPRPKSASPNPPSPSPRLFLLPKPKSSLDRSSSFGRKSPLGSEDPKSSARRSSNSSLPASQEKPPASRLELLSFPGLSDQNSSP
mmetsp:Transcript_46620/g.95011  ORF Transcript_46620/g.95011 Transcript_46620/m.95011 type:complete len:312 (-) Transcript_46620:343-1278(-)